MLAEGCLCLDEQDDRMLGDEQRPVVIKASDAVGRAGTRLQAALGERAFGVLLVGAPCRELEAHEQSIGCPIPAQPVARERAHVADAAERPRLGDLRAVMIV